MTPDLGVEKPTPVKVTHDSRRMRRAIAITAAIMVLVGVVLLFLLAQATNNRELYERNYARLFAVNVVVAVALFAAIAWVGYRLYMRLRQGRFGSRLLVKLATIFALVGLAPGLLIYVVSYQFVSRSIETWFDVKVEGALVAGLDLGRVTLETLSGDLANKSRSAAIQLTGVADATTGLALERMLDQLGANEVTVWSSNSNLIASAGTGGVQLTPHKPTAQQIRAARTSQGISWVDGLEDVTAGADATAYVRALIPIDSPGLGLTVDSRVLLVSRVLPANLVTNALAVDAANREYQERALAREGLKRMYIGTLTLSLFLAVFAAVLLAVILGNQIARPLLLLTEGVSQVAAGDLTPKLAMQGRDELGGLTRAFASMTQQLADARHAVENSMSQVDAARANLQTILDNLTSGVMVLAQDYAIRSFNPGAVRILQVALQERLGQPLTDIPALHDFGKAVQQQFAEFSATPSEVAKDHWQSSFELRPYASLHAAVLDQTITLVARGAHLPGNAYLLVFDDISDIVSAQRAQAWGEVARRLAHEIKNPLTPIQLSAERLERRLGGKLELAEQGVLTKSVRTIVDQVDAMKRLVNEFRDYARLPAAELKPVDLNALVKDVLHLYDEETMAVPVQVDLDAANPAVMGDAQQLRQVIHNLVQNAQDASEACRTSENAEPPKVLVRTQWRPSTARVQLSVIDNGGGFPENILKRAFEPYVTTKSKGTGLGLAVVKKIADEHGARIDVSNRIVEGEVVGAQVSLSLMVDPSAQT
jgi:nitrogen fixation/metabolism regulation signal transduction histidine kinase